MNDLEQIKQAIQIALRSVEAAHTQSQQIADTNQHLAEAIQQVAFAVDKLAEVMSREPALAIR